MGNGTPFGFYQMLLETIPTSWHLVPILAIGRQTSFAFRCGTNFYSRMPNPTKIAQNSLRAMIGFFLAILTYVAIAPLFVNIAREFHPVFGRIPKKDSRFVWRLEGNGVGSWGANCVRGASKAQTQGNTILILGDSFTEALQVDDDEHFAFLLEKKLKEKGMDRNVVAVGRSSHSVADYVAQAPQFLALHSPDWVVIQVTADDFGRDAWNKNLPGFARFQQNSLSDTIQVISVPVRDSNLLGRIGERVPFLAPFLLFTANRQGAALAWIKDNEQPWFHAQRREVSAKSGPNSLSKYPVGSEVELLAQAFQKRLTILYLPPFDPKRVDAEEPAEAFVRVECEKSGVQFASLREKFHELHESGRCPYGFENTRFNEGHWNRYGHQAAAAVLTGRFLSKQP
jgi:lysophospholipase L1-like esterase